MEGCTVPHSDALLLQEKAGRFERNVGVSRLADEKTYSATDLSFIKMSVVVRSKASND